jgi:EpsI family protein
MAWTMTPQRLAPRVDRDPFVVFPMQLGEWRGSASVLEREIERVLAADDYLSATYAEPAGAPVNLFVAFYHSQTDGGGIHSPEVCIPAGGWEVSSWRERAVTLPSGESFMVNRAVIQKGLSRQLVYFWFEQRGRRMTSDYAAKLVTVYDSLRSGRTDGGLVRLITPIGQSETEDAADARLTAFVAEATAALPRFVPR